MLGPNRFGLGFGPPPDPSTVTVMPDLGGSRLWASVATANTTSKRRRFALTLCSDGDKGNPPCVTTRMIGHEITRSAWARTERLSVRPIAFAAVRFTVQKY